MDVAIAILVIAIVIGIAYVSYVKSENEDLKNYVEFYRRQLRSAFEGYDCALDMLHDASEWYSELTNEYRDLCAAYEVAYSILKEHDLLPEDEE